MLTKRAGVDLGRAPVSASRAHRVQGAFRNRRSGRVVRPRLHDRVRAMDSRSRRGSADGRIRAAQDRTELSWPLAGDGDDAIGMERGCADWVTPSRNISLGWPPSSLLSGVVQGRPPVAIQSRCTSGVKWGCARAREPKSKVNSKAYSFRSAATLSAISPLSR